MAGVFSIRAKSSCEFLSVDSICIQTVNVYIIIMALVHFRTLVTLRRVRVWVSVELRLGLVRVRITVRIRVRVRFRVRVMLG